MVGASTFALQTCAGSGCPAGAALKQYYLAGQGSGQIDSSSDYPITAATVAVAGGPVAVFTTTLPAGASTAALPLIFASGAVYSDGALRWEVAEGDRGLLCPPALAPARHTQQAGAATRTPTHPPGLCCPARRQHSTYGSATLDLTTGALTSTEWDSQAVSALVAVSTWPVARDTAQRSRRMPACIGRDARTSASTHFPPVPAGPPLAHAHWLGRAAAGGRSHRARDEAVGPAVVQAASCVTGGGAGVREEQGVLQSAAERPPPAAHGPPAALRLQARCSRWGC